MWVEAKYKSGILVGVQMVCIFFLLVKIPFSHIDLWALLISFLGLLLGFWAIVAMQLDNISVRPDVKQNARLVIHGPYKVIRHPMYSAVLLTFTPLVIDHFSIFLVIVLFILLVTLLIKMKYEEKLLRNHFEAYASYSKHSWKIIPFIY